MATVECDDGSKLVLTEEEFMLYLRATGKIVPAKTQAEIIAEKMIQVAEASRPVIDMGVREAKFPPPPAPEPPQIELTIVDEAELRESAQHTLAQEEADATQQPVEIGNYFVMPGGRVLPKHVRPGGIPPRPKVHIPYTKREMPVMQVLKEVYPQALTTNQIATRLNQKPTLVTNALSQVFRTGRGLKKGLHRAWTLETWAYRAVWVLDGTPSRRWPPKEEGES